MDGKICPILTSDGPEKDCAGERCMLFVEGRTSSTCALVKLPRKAVVRLDTLSAQIQEVQIVLNQLLDKA